MSVLFFDIGATLADARVEPDGSLTLRPRPRVTAVLDAFPDTPKGIVSNPGTGDEAAHRAAAALEQAFPGRFPDAGLLHWGAKDSRALFDTAVASAPGVPAGDCVFVGEDPRERAFAQEAGMRTAAHPVLTLAAVENRPVHFARIGVPDGRGLPELAAAASTAEVVPLHVASDRLVLAMASALGAEALERAGFTVDLREPVEDSAAFLIRDNRPVAQAEALVGSAGTPGPADAEARRATALHGFVTDALAAQGAPPPTTLGPAPSGVYLAVPAGAPVEQIHLPGAKPGHTERLLPDPMLLPWPGETRTHPLTDTPVRERHPESGNGLPSPATIAAVRATVTSEALRGHVARLSGAQPLAGGQSQTVRSRDAAADDNAQVVEALADRFRELGLVVRQHPFRWWGRQLFNVEAEHRVAGAESTVLITAHMDSTAANGDFVDPNGNPRDYDPAVDPAPGADDDASGTAAVLAAAECLAALLADGGRPTRNVRFVLFNAEEQGLVGSKFYARAAAAQGDNIAGVFQMDMIAGLQPGSTPIIEIHAGSFVPGPVVEASDALGELVARTVPAFGPAVTVQHLTGPDDPARGRSDHASFHERGWAAIAVSEDLFSTSDGAPGTGTRQYHTPADTLLDQDHDTDFAATVAGSVIATALTLAGL
ncbi:M20/M25/M40 family metallo-hydrolase [Streptomyces sp.]|uniref:M20/M25/M40 family metallo-hydrolase n=1 Tax=Streptomyces sp. TaxID=1931 RepID=UPI002811281F|nr:M20/M25/M40 family metallo-hydrolase [Streptomyces sp.]